MEFDKLFLKFITTTTTELRIPKTLLKNQKKNEIISMNAGKAFENI